MLLKKNRLYIRYLKKKINNLYEINIDRFLVYL